MSDPLLSVEEAAAISPWSKSTLYREAPKEDSPFRKRGGRWVTTESDLIAWARSGSKAQRRDAISRDPMGPVRPRKRDSFRAHVIELQARREAA